MVAYFGAPRPRQQPMFRPLVISGPLRPVDSTAIGRLIEITFLDSAYAKRRNNLQKWEKFLPFVLSELDRDKGMRGLTSEFPELPLAGQEGMTDQEGMTAPGSRFGFTDISWQIASKLRHGKCCLLRGNCRIGNYRPAMPSNVILMESWVAAQFESRGLFPWESRTTNLLTGHFRQAIFPR